MIPWAELKCIAIFPMQVYLSDDGNISKSYLFKFSKSLANILGYNSPLTLTTNR